MDYEALLLALQEDNKPITPTKTVAAKLGDGDGDNDGEGDGDSDSDSDGDGGGNSGCADADASAGKSPQLIKVVESSPIKKREGGYLWKPELMDNSFINQVSLDNLSGSDNPGYKRLQKQPLNVFNPEDKIKLDATYQHINPGEIKISVMAAICGMNCNYINLNVIGESRCVCGVLCCTKKKCEPVKPKKEFYNQKTVLIPIEGEIKPKNMKVFKNGMAHLMGLKSQEQGRQVITKAIEILKTLHNEQTHKICRLFLQEIISQIGDGEYASTLHAILCQLPDPTAWKTDKKLTKFIKLMEKKNCLKQSITDTLIETLLNTYKEYNKQHSLLVDDQVTLLKPVNFETILVNSHFAVGFKICREKLNHLLVNKYGFVGQSDYEPDNYPGVNSKFYWNLDNQHTENFGICTCTVKCNGKGSGKGNGQCKRVTTAVFASGKIIITGARSKEQISDCYHFINTVMDMNFDHIYRKQIPLMPKKSDPQQSQQIIYKHRITNLDVYKMLREMKIMPIGVATNN
jgi:TATA-box binding protein (TBP) (component of TFIID and TFIIIB)